MWRDANIWDTLFKPKSQFHGEVGFPQWYTRQTTDGHRNLETALAQRANSVKMSNWWTHNQCKFWDRPVFQLNSNPNQTLGKLGSSITRMSMSLWSKIVIAPKQDKLYTKEWSSNVARKQQYLGQIYKRDFFRFYVIVTFWILSFVACYCNLMILENVKYLTRIQKISFDHNIFKLIW